MKTKTYRELKEFLNSLTEEQLNQEILLQITEYKSFDHLYGSITQEDYVDPDGYGASPLSSFDKDYLFEEEIEVVLKKGTVVLGTN